MTYNFDPDRWFENQRLALEGRLQRGELDAAAYQAELAHLETRYDRMLERLNKAFELSERPPRP